MTEKRKTMGNRAADRTYEIQCPSCGMCYRECVLQADAITQTEYGVKIDLDRCSRCGHCAAVCPTGCMEHPYAPLQTEQPLVLPPEEALAFLRTPRSVRRYRSDLVPKDVIERLLNAGRYPQTAKNAQGMPARIRQLALSCEPWIP